MTKRSEWNRGRFDLWYARHGWIVLVGVLLLLAAACMGNMLL